jgi:hypothetical protein
MNRKVQFINPEQAQRAIAVAWSARVPLNLVGAPGVGKTSAVEQFVARVQAKDPAFGYWPVILAMKGPEDFGLPAPSGSKLKYLFPTDLPLGDDKAKGVLFLDEWDRCPDPAVQNAAMQLTLGGHFHGTTMSKDVFTVLAMNGTSDIHTSPVSEAARTRMVHLYIGTSATGYWGSWGDWARANDEMPPEVAGFVSSRADLLRKDEEFEELAAFNPRTGGGLLARLAGAIAKTKVRTDDIELPLLAGAVGRGAALEFLAYRAIWREMPDLDEVLRHPDRATVPDKPGTLFAVAMALVRKLDNNGTAKKALTYIKRWPDEPAAFAADMIRRAHPEVIALPEFGKWANQAL